MTKESAVPLWPHHWFHRGVDDRISYGFLRPRGMQDGRAGRWSEETFGKTALGDIRRTRRLVSMARAAATRPSGKVSTVFDRARDREGAYDFLENPHVNPAALAESVFAATVARAQS